MSPRVGGLYRVRRLHKGQAGPWLGPVRVLRVATMRTGAVVAFTELGSFPVTKGAEWEPVRED
jgi:hypothetical protein